MFLNRYGDRITQREEFLNSSKIMPKYGLDKRSGLPSFIPSQICKNFPKEITMVSLFACLGARSDIETTRIYFVITASEQQELVDKIVTW